MYLNVLVLVVLFATTIKAEKDFNYYKNLWQENLIKAAEWQQPTENAEFKNINLNNCTPIEESYDFVIVGGGTAGAVLASRLSEIPSYNVLVLEAGNDETDFSMMPGAYLLATRSPMNWGYRTVPQRNACLGRPEAKCNLPRGKTLGGETALKDVTYVRGNRDDFLDWGPHWIKRSITYFRKMENATLIDSNVYRGQRGPFVVSYPEPKGPLTDEILSAHQELGLPIIKDYNGRQQLGVARMQAYTKFGRRHSVNQAYLKPVAHRTNLRIITNSLVTKILFDKSDPPKAEGVNFLNNGSCFIAYSNKEIILTSGPINTPQLLMLSGIGDPKELSKHGIEVVKNLPQVGKNLEDHLCFMDFTITVNKTYKYQKFDDELKLYAEKGIGSLSAPLASQIAFVKTKLSNARAPDVEVMYVELNPKLVYPPIEIPDGTLLNEIYAEILLLHPKSKGIITLKSSSSIDHPLIDPRYLSVASDMENLVRMVKFVAKLVDTSSFRRINATVAMGKMTPEQCAGLDDYALWRCIVKYNTAPMHHLIGTCKMGTNGRDSVVDAAKLLVHGLANLRIVDSSVIPQSTSGHTVPVVVMMAETIADLIKNTYRLNK